MKTCEICGKDISERRGRARFCIECAQRRITERNEAKRKTKVCEICGAPLYGKTRKYCPKCADEQKKHASTQKERHCQVCGKVIVGRRYNAKYCTECAAIVKKSGNNLSCAMVRKRELEAKAKEPQYGNQIKCKRCRFYDRYTKCCDYIGITGIPRRCEPGPKCEKYKEREEGRRLVPLSLRKENEDETGLFS